MIAYYYGNKILVIARGRSIRKLGLMKELSSNTIRFKAWRFGLVWMLLALLALPMAGGNTPAASAATNDVTYFPITGHYMSGAFKNYWERNGGLSQFGYPLTEPFMQKSPTDSKIYVTQFFERAVFEYHPENAGTRYEVLLSLLGRNLTSGREGEKPFQRVSGSANTAARTYFSQTGHYMAYGFKNYWEANGGLAQFGYPITEEFSERNPADGKTYTVQYFERARFEFHPEFQGTKYEVLLGLLGWQQMNRLGVRQDVQAKQPAGKENFYTGSGTSGAPKVLPEFGGPAFPLKGPHIGYGMNVWLLGQDKDRVLGLVKNAGFSWVRQQVGWDVLEPSPGQYQWAELDSVVEAAQRHGIHLIFSVVRAPHWAGVNGTSGLPANPAVFGQLMQRMALRYQGRVDAYEVWNEQNIERETGGGRVEVRPYIETLKAGYQGVKASDPWAVVIYGGLSPTGINDPNYAVDDAVFLEQSYQYNNGEMRKYFDVLGVHPGNAANTPDELWPTNPPADKNRPWSTHASFYFRRVENLRAIMEKYGDANKQVWLTEFGWTTSNAAPGYEYGALVSEQQQANYLVGAFQRSKTQYPWMGVMSVWQLNFATFLSPADEKGPWGLIRGDWSTRPSYDALKAMPK
jgi:hypothetical protein